MNIPGESVQPDPPELAQRPGGDFAGAIRADFPALKRLHNGYAVAYFDGPGGSQVPIAVGQAMSDYLYNHNANRGWTFASSRETDDVVRSARAALADWIGGAPEEVAFGPSMTALTFQLSRALARTWREGDNIVLTEQDHHANIDPWRLAAMERGTEIRMASVVADGSLDLNDLTQKIDSRTRLLAFAAASNVLGTVNDVGLITAIAKDRGACVFVDAVHYSGHRAAYAENWGCDFVVCSAYKFYAPRMAALWTRRSVLDSITGYTLSPAPSTGPAKFETGAISHEGLAGVTAAIDYLAALSPGRAPRRVRLEAAARSVREHESWLFDRLWNGLQRNQNITLFGPPPGAERTATISFAVRDVAAQQVCQQLGEKGIFLSHGNFYAETLVRKLGYGQVGLARAGCMMYTTAEDVDRLIDALAAVGKRH